jgi:integrative and conjugative element protein (TIGR02256 family)
VKSAVAETCWFALSAAHAICADADLYAPLETGGVLMGYFASKAAVVTHAVLGGYSATRTSSSFEPDYEFQQIEIDRIYEQSGRNCTYLGDWHSHPLGSSELSREDERTLRRIARTYSARLRSPLMLILGDGDSWGFGVWQFRPRMWNPWTRIQSVPVNFFEDRDQWFVGR